MGLNFVFDPNMQQFQLDKSTINHVHNKIDELVLNRSNKC